MKKSFSLLLITLLISLSACTDDSQVSADQPVVEAPAVPQTMSAADLAAQEAKKANKYARSTDGVFTGRTRIVDGVIVEWAEEFPEDKNNKPIRYEVLEGYSSPGHSLFYNVDGSEVEVVVNEDSNDRRFYEDGHDYTFAHIYDGVEKSNEAVLKSVAANDRLNEEMKKYR